jgi:glutathione S-transferase
VSDPKIVVYGPSRSPFIGKVVHGLAYKGFRDPELIEPTGPEDFRRLNPATGMLPVMDFDGVRVPDSSGILDWLDERYPDPPLVSRDAWIARQQRRLESWIGETFYYYWVRWLRKVIIDSTPPASSPDDPRAPDPGLVRRGELARLGILGRVGEILEHGGQARGGGLGPEFQRRLDDMVSFLGDRPFFHADRPSRADLTALAFLESLENDAVPGGKGLVAARPRLVALVERVRSELEP